MKNRPCKNVEQNPIKTPHEKRHKKCSEESMQWLTVYVLIQNMPESLGIGLRGCMLMEKNRWDMR